MKMARAGFVLLSALMVGKPALGEQSLDEGQVALLTDYCRALVGNDFVNFYSNAGPQLFKLCQLPGGGGGTPPPVGSGAGGTGAGANSTASLVAGGQSSFAVLSKRIGKQRGEQEKGVSGGGAGDEDEWALGNGWNAFVSGQFESVDRKQTRFESGYQSSIQGFLSGVDVHVDDWMLAGVAVNYRHDDSTFADTGGFRTDAFGPMAYLSMAPIDNAFVDIMLEYKHQWRERTRFSGFDDPNTGHRTAGLINADYGVDQYGANVRMGYDLIVGAFSIGPRLSFRYSDVTIGTYEETGRSGLELRFLRDRITFMQSSLGLQASAAVGSAMGIFTPQVHADWTHEFQNDQRDSAAQFVQDGRDRPVTFVFNNDRPDRDFFSVGAGMGLVLPNGIQPYINFEALLGHRYFDQLTGTAGVRIEFQ